MEKPVAPHLAELRRRVRADEAAPPPERRQPGERMDRHAGPQIAPRHRAPRHEEAHERRAHDHLRRAAQRVFERREKDVQHVLMHQAQRRDQREAEHQKLAPERRRESPAQQRVARIRRRPVLDDGDPQQDAPADRRDGEIHDDVVHPAAPAGELREEIEECIQPVGHRDFAEREYSLQPPRGQPKASARARSNPGLAGEDDGCDLSSHAEGPLHISRGRIWERCLPPLG